MLNMYVTDLSLIQSMKQLAESKMECKEMASMSPGFVWSLILHSQTCITKLTHLGEKRKQLFDLLD